MSASRAYDRPYATMEFVCKCGVRCRIDIEIGSLAAADSFQHCDLDRARIVGGPILSAWEQRDGEWNRTSY